MSDAKIVTERREGPWNEPAWGEEGLYASGEWIKADCDAPRQNIAADDLLLFLQSLFTFKSFFAFFFFPVIVRMD